MDDFTKEFEQLKKAQELKFKDGVAVPNYSNLEAVPSSKPKIDFETLKMLQRALKMEGQELSVEEILQRLRDGRIKGE